MYDQIFIFLAEEEARGGLFDIGATLPLVAIQFLILMFVLNTILYNPLITFMNERNEYVLDNLSKASEMLKTAEELKTQYENDLALTKKEAQREISEAQKLQKALFETEINSAQEAINGVVETSLQNLTSKKEAALATLTSEVDSISTRILARVFTPRVKA